MSPRRARIAPQRRRSWLLGWPGTAGQLAKILQSCFQPLQHIDLHKESEARYSQNPVLATECGFDSLQLRDLTPAVFADWRDRRLAVVSGAAVQRDMNLIGAALSTACKEWGWLPANPLHGVRRPKAAPARDRLVKDEECAKLCHVFGYVPPEVPRTHVHRWRGRDVELRTGLGAGEVPRTISARVGAAFCFSIETGLRAGELCALTWADITGAVARVERGKTAAARCSAVAYGLAHPGAIARTAYHFGVRPTRCAN